MVGSPVDGVLVGHRDDLVLVEGRVERKVSELGMEAVLIGLQHAGIGELRVLDVAVVAARIKNGPRRRGISD